MQRSPVAVEAEEGSQVPAREVAAVEVPRAAAEARAVEGVAALRVPPAAQAAAAVVAWAAAALEVVEAALAVRAV